MNSFRLKVEQALNHLQSGNISLGNRLLLDCVLDSENVKLFDEMIQIATWQEEKQVDEKTFQNKQKDIITINLLNFTLCKGKSLPKVAFMSGEILVCRRLVCVCIGS